MMLCFMTTVSVQLRLEGDKITGTFGTQLGVILGLETIIWGREGDMTALPSWQGTNISLINPSEQFPQSIEADPCGK